MLLSCSSVTNSIPNTKRTEMRINSSPHAEKNTNKWVNFQEWECSQTNKYSIQKSKLDKMNRVFIYLFLCKKDHVFVRNCNIKLV